MGKYCRSTGNSDPSRLVTEAKFIFKIDDLHLAKFIMSGGTKANRKAKVERHVLSACILVIPCCGAVARSVGQGKWYALLAFVSRFVPKV